MSQAWNYTDLLGDWLAGEPRREWLHKICFYELQDDPSPSVPKWGILRADGSEKAAYRAYREAVKG